MTLVIDIVDGLGLSNTVHCKCLLRKTKFMCSRGNFNDPTLIVLQLKKRVAYV